jgi:hypothetical protein
MQTPQKGNRSQQNYMHGSVNTKKWYRKEADLWAELGDEIPFG